MQKNDAVRRSDMPKTPRLLAVLFTGTLAASCGGPESVLHDVLDEAEERVETVLEGLIDNQDDFDEALTMEIPPCVEEYSPPPLAESPAPYADAVERPAELPEGRELQDELTMHRTMCERKDTVLAEYRRMTDGMIPQLEDFAAYVDAMREHIDDEMTLEEVEALTAEIEAIAEARPAEEDTLGLRYDRLERRMREASPLVREMAGGARRPGTRVRPGNLPERGTDELTGLIRPWTELRTAIADANAFFGIWNDYRRQIYEGPGSEDPEEAAAGWNAPTGIWTGEYNQLRYTYGRSARRVRVTIDEAGGTEVYWPDDECGGDLEVTSKSGAADRVTVYLDPGGTCGNYEAQLTLDRTGENKMRLYWSTPRDEVGGNLTRE